jgi:hypothetical protein
VGFLGGGRRQGKNRKDRKDRMDRKDREEDRKIGRKPVNFTGNGQGIARNLQGDKK